MTRDLELSACHEMQFIRYGADPAHERRIADFRLSDDYVSPSVALVCQPSRVALMPPSTYRVAPWIIWASSEARKATA
jgi:hypothetical protein